MAQKFLDSFDLYNTADIPQKWLGGEASGGVWAIQNSIVRTGAQAIYCNNSNGAWLVAPSFASTAEFIVGFAVNYQSSGDGMLTFFDSTTNTVALELRVNRTTAALEVYQFNGAIVATGPSLPSNQWTAIGVDVKFSSAGAGTCKVYVNGALVLNLTGLTTGTTSIADSVILGSGYAHASTFQNIVAYYDDFFIYDATGAHNNAYPGDVKILALLPNGEGRVNQWSPTGAAPNYACVNEVPPDGDTTYVADSTVGHEDTYTLQALSGASAVLGVQVCAFARKDDIVSRAIDLGVGNGASESYGSDIYLGANYSYVTQEFDQNPLTSANWATGDFTTLQAAVKVAV